MKNQPITLAGALRLAVAAALMSGAVMSGAATPGALAREPGAGGAPQAADASAPPPTDPAALKELRPGVLPGYLPREQLVDSLALLAPPPSPGSPQAVADEAVRAAASRLRDTPRGRLAARDADYRSPAVVEAFSCALGVKISRSATPHLNMLLRRTLTDAGAATLKAKQAYFRQRPFVVSPDHATCYPADEEHLRKDGSYPSGHAAFGWTWALVLAAAAPEKANAILRRGYEFGQSRVICNYHWQSDVDAGRLIGAAVAAQLQSSPVFRAQLAEAAREIRAAQASGADAPDCSVEQAAAAMTTAGVK
ncbi:phosphatase PAP2 family protein [Camelimonas abortus]|uniref:Phosphatase PAP2 family protein n=1 Tax=Camelimonas abortus TaxID=1017184 RepID=A0ABV7LAT2_9HYPH